MSNKRFVLCFLVVLCIMTSVFGETGGVFVQSELYPSQKTETFAQQLGLTAEPVAIPTNAVAQATGNPNYPVTPGDVYTLTYREGATLVTENLFVDGQSKIQTSYAEVVNASEKTFVELKQLVESTITSLYPYSKPQLTITSCGIFCISISGQVNYSQEIQVWALTKLSDLSWYVTDYASTRNIEVEYADGTVKSFDLYKALACAESENNPLLKPGCSVKFCKAATTVTLDGCARKTGTFQTLENETLEDLINCYGEGLLNNADASQFAVSRFQNGQFTTEIVARENAKNYVLKDGDNVCVRSAMQDMPYIIVEGALNGATEENGSKIFYQYFPGETAEDLIRSLKSSFTTSTNTKAIYLTRADGTIVSLNADLILTTSGAGNTELMEGDVLTVPFNKQTVTVSGAVAKPGSYAYVTGKNYDYYINMAGGYSADARKAAVKVIDAEGAGVAKRNDVLANSIINVPHRSTNASSDIALVTAVIGMITAGITLYATLAK